MLSSRKGYILQGTAKVPMDKRSHDGHLKSLLTRDDLVVVVDIVVARALLLL